MRSYPAVAGVVLALAACSTSKHDPATSPPGGSPSAQDPPPSNGGSPPAQDPPPSGNATAPQGTEGGSWLDLDGRAAPPHASPAPENTGPATRGGTLTFTNIGAAGFWGRRIEADPGDPRCDVQAETIDYSWGGSDFCCRTQHVVTSDRLTPFNEQMAMVLDGPLRVKQLAVYQPLDDVVGPWALRSYWDRQAANEPFNLHFVGPGNETQFDGVLGNNCTFHATQERPFPCGPGSDPYCPGSALDYDGWAGSKLFVLLASMPYADDPAMQPLSCIAADEDEREQDAPWIGLGASELDRDGWAGYHPCHCYSNTEGMLGDGCGQINVFEVIAEASGERWGNRDVISTGVRSYQVGSLGGATCGIEGCGIEQFPTDADLLDANSVTAMPHGAVIDADDRQSAEGPVWRRALDDRYYFALLDEATRTVQVAVLHPAAVPEVLDPLLPALPNEVGRSVIDDLIALRLPAED